MNRILLLCYLLNCCLGFAQHQDKVDFIRGEVLINPIPEEKRIEGSVTYEFDISKDIDSVFLDAKNMEFSLVQLNGKKTEYSNDGKTISIHEELIKGKSYRLKLAYKCVPKQTVYFLGWDDSIVGNEQIWTQGQGKYTSYWLPSFDDMEEKVEFDLSFSRQLDGQQIIANGVLKEVKRNHKGGQIISFDMRNPMCSYLLAFAIGNYNKKDLTSESGIPLENYYYPQDSLRVEPTYRYTKEIFDFLEKEIGVPYPWQNYKQVPVKDFLYAGMENTGTTIFSDQYVIDATAFVDKNYVNVNAHEMAHQWFGNLVTEKDGNHHWLHEGFATYYAYLAEKEIFGEDHFYWKLYNSIRQLKSVQDRGEGQSLMDPKASSLTFYEKGAWALFMLRNDIGDKNFKKGIQSYLKTYAFKNATIDDFLKQMESASGKKLHDFRKQWLEQSELPLENAKLQLAEKSASLKLLFELESDLHAASTEEIDYHRYWDASNSVHLKQHLLENYKEFMRLGGMQKGLESDTIPIRQALLESSAIDDLLPKEHLMNLLADDSYLTKEMALFQLWQGYPEDRDAYLNKTKDVIGLPNKNVRLMWLTLAILTEGYQARNTKLYFDELSGYTGAQYAFEVRQGAFFYLNEAFGFTEQNLLDLVKASNHHTWQFKKFARDLIDELLKDKVYKDRLKGIVDKLKPEEKRYIQSKLN